MKKQATERFAYEPDYATPPGGTLQETIDALGMTQAQLAARTGLSKKTVNRIIQGHEPISHETALKLERVTGVPAHFWNERELLYRERMTRQASQKDLESAHEWLDSLPIAEMRKLQIVPNLRSTGALADAVLRFFQVGSPAEWQQLWTSPSVSLRKSPAFESNPGAVAVWLRLAEIKAAQKPMPAFDREAFRSRVDSFRGLSLSKPVNYVKRLVDSCAECGLALVMVPEIKGTRVSGAARWITATKPMIVLSLRSKRDDQFWFSLFHEIAHILKHGKKRVFVDDDKAHQAVEEIEADTFARESLIPRSYEDELPTLLYPGQVKNFARKIGVAPGIVAGRLQRDRQDFKIFYDLKEVVDFRVVEQSLGEDIYG